jgi:type II secretory pathway component PulF
MTVAAIIGGSLAAIVLLAPRLPGAFAARVDAATLGLPWAGPTLARARVLQLLFALETLSGGGVPVDTALVEAGNAVGDHAVSAAARRTAERVRLGMPLAPAFRAEPVIPERVCAWVGIGERTGDVTAVFSRLRSYLQAESERAGERFMTLIEPTLMIVVGAGMVALIAGVVLPVFAAFGGAL